MIPAGAWCALVLYNLLALAVMGWDKIAACRSWRRVPERRLLLMALLLGAAGVGAGMVLFRHKTAKPKFTYTVPLLLVLQIALAIYLSRPSFLVWVVSISCIL